VSLSAATLINGDGQTVKYANVTELIGNTAQHKTEYTYSIDRYDYTSSINTYPFASGIARDWRSGLLLTTRVYERLSNGAYRVLNSTNTNYTFYEETANERVGLKFGATVNGGFRLLNYRSSTEWMPKIREIDTVFNYFNTTVPQLQIQTRDYNYNKNNSYSLSGWTTLNSKNDRIKMNFTYAGDYADPSGFSVPALKSNNMVELSIKKEQSINGSIVDGEIIRYDGLGRPVEVYSFESDSPVDTSIVNPSFVLTPGYTSRNHIRYNNTRSPQIAEVQASDGVFVSYLWSYQGKHAIAELTNLSYEQIKAVISENAINAFSDLVNPTKAEIDSFISPLRTNFPEAQIITYSYKPLVGLTTQTDPKGRTTYYEYDDFGRLKWIKDQNGNIVKENQYHYRN